LNSSHWGAASASLLLETPDKCNCVATCLEHKPVNILNAWLNPGRFKYILHLPIKSEDSDSSNFLEETYNAGDHDGGCVGAPSIKNDRT
jgi:hypothetical protein